jgi:hypothetical protein
MIEAVNSVLASAPLLRQNAEQQSGAQASSSPEAVREILKAPYLDVVRLDVDYDTAVLVLRDSQSGDAVQQIPNEEALIKNKRLAETSERANEVREVQEVQDGEGTQVSASAPTTSSSPIPSQELAAFASGEQAGSSAGSSTFTTFA